MLMCAIITGSRVRKAIFMIVEKKNLKTGIRRKIFGCFFAIVMILLSLFGTLPGTGVDVYAEPEEGASKSSGASCQDSLGSLGWLVCPMTGKISEAVDFLYPAKSIGLACPDIVVSKKLIANNDICVTKIGKNSNTNCFNFCENVLVSFIKSPFYVKKKTLTIIQFNQKIEKE